LSAVAAWPGGTPAATLTANPAANPVANSGPETSSGIDPAGKKSAGKIASPRRLSQDLACRSRPAAMRRQGRGRREKQEPVRQRHNHLKQQGIEGDR
jgi:hypothetical protein